MISKKYFNELKKKYLIIYKQEFICSRQLPNKVIGNTVKKNQTKIKLNYFWNQSFDKNRLKIFVFWCFQNYGQSQTIKVLEILKNIGFQYATKAGLSLSIDDLIIPPTKSKLLIDAELITRTAMTKYKNAQITNLERFQKIIETWHITSEKIKDDMIHHFKTTNIFNPLYMMAFSGARGNVSQVRQLVGMRGLMANPQGQILDFPIRSNFREGLTLTEYVISCYGARKGVVDTALRTANAGYLTRRLVDVAQHIIISNFDCGTNRGILVSEMKQGNKSLFSLKQRLLGRVLAKNILSGTLLIARKNEEISENLSEIISSFLKTVLIRSPLTCQTTQFICQRCYGWSLAEGKLVSVGEIVGIIAAQSIGEPGTQLTMRTFHTGGVFAGELIDQLIAPFGGKVNYNIYIPGNMIRTPQGSIAFLTRIESKLVLEDVSDGKKSKQYKLPPYTILFIRNREMVAQNQLLAQFCTFSPSFKNSGSNLIEYKIYSDLEGEIKSTNLKILKKITEMNDIMHRSLQWGYIWILSGKIYQLPFNSIDGLQIKSSGKKNFFPIQGDLLTKSSILSNLLWIHNNENVKLTFQEETNFYQKFTNNKKIYLSHCKQLNPQWLQKWSVFLNKDRLTNLNNAIKKFSKNLELLSEESIINVQSQNLLLFLTIDKIRYKDFAYFIIIKKKFKKTSIKISDQTKQRAKKQPNHSLISHNFLQETKQLKKKTRLGRNLDNENKIFLSIPLEYNKNQSTTLITQPKFFYQKQSNLFFEWFSNESHLVKSGLLNFSEIFIYQNQGCVKKDKRKKEDIITSHYTEKKIMNVKKLQQNLKSFKLTNAIKDYLFPIQNNFLYSFAKKKQIEYLNSYYSKIIFSFYPFIESQKQFLSELKFFKKSNYIDYVNSIKKLNFLQSIYFLFGKKTKRLNSRNKYKDYKTCYDLKKQILNYKILKKRHKFESNKYIRFKIDDIKKENDKIIQLNVGRNTELIKFKDYKTTEKNVFLQKKMLLLNKLKNLKKLYISLKPIYFFYKQFNNDIFLRKKIFYNNLQFKMLFKHKKALPIYNQNKQQHKFFMFLSKDFLTKNLFFDFYQYIENKSKFLKNSSIFQKFSTLFMNFNTLETKSRKNDLFCQDFVLKKFYYIDLKTIQNKKKFTIFKKYHTSKNNKKFEELKKIKNLKKFYSSFTYYIIKNQFRFDPSFQAQSINELENIYKKEVKNVSNLNSYTQKLLLIKSLNKKSFSSFLSIKKNQTNCLFKNKKLISIHNAYQKLPTTYDFPKLLKKMEKAKHDFKNKKYSQSIMNDTNSLKYLFQSISMFSNFMFHKKNNIYQQEFFDFKHKNLEKNIFNSLDLIGIIDYKKHSPMLLIKYKKNKIHINGFLFSKISIFKHLFLRQQSINFNKKLQILIHDEEGLINNQINKFILKMYLIKLYSKKNIVVNHYFELISFKWLALDTKSILEKTKILNPIFFKRLYFSNFINKNIILSEEKSKTDKTNIELEKTNKQKRFNKYSRNDNPTLKIKNQRFLLYTRFSLVSQDYLKTFKKYFLMIIFNAPQNNFNKTLKVLLKTKNNSNLCYQSNTLSLFQLQESYFLLKTDKKKLKLKKKIKLSTLKNFLNLRKSYNRKTKNILSKKSYLQKINILGFHLLEICYNKKFELFETTRQFQYIPLQFSDSYGILRLEKDKKKFSISSVSPLSRDKNIFSLYKKSLRILKNKWQILKNKTDILITNEPSWICKPIKKNTSTFSFTEFKHQSKENFYCLFVLLGNKLKIFNPLFKKDVHSIHISYKYCEKELNWLNFTFLKMIEWFEKLHKFYFQKNNKSTLDNLVFFENKMILLKRKFIGSLKTQIKNDKKTTGYYWFINKKARFIIMNQFNNCNINLKENSKTKTVKQYKDIDKFFCIIKVQEFFINNYQNLSYLSNTNLVFFSKKKLLNNIKEKNRDNFSCNNNGLILKFQYNSIFLNKQKVSKKLISKFPNLELTFEQHLNIPSKNLNNSLKNNSKSSFRKQPVLFSKNRREYHDFLKSKKIQTIYLENNNKRLNTNYLDEKKIKRFKFRKPIRIFRNFLVSFLPINFDFSFQSSAISWNFFPNSYLANLKFEKKFNTTKFIIYLIYKNQRLNKLDVKINKNDCILDNIKNFAMLINFSCALNTLLRQPCIDWSISQSITIGYKKNNFLAPTKTVLLLSKINYLKNNYPIALTKFYSGLKGEILYSLETKKQQFKKTSINEIDSKINENSLFPESVLKSQSSLFLTTSDLITFKFKNDIILSNQLNFGDKLKFNIFQNQRHIRSLKIFQIKSVKQIKLIFQILRKIHNRCQFTNQSIKINLGLFVFQGDLLTTCFKTYLLHANGTKINNIQSIIINHSGQIVHLNRKKITLRKGQPVFFSPNCIFHSYNSDFIEQNKPVLSLPYQQLKTGDIVQGIPKIEQLFEARLSFGGKLEFDNLTNILNILFQTYKKKLQWKLAVRRSIELIQMIIINSIQRIYRSQGVTISDKHLEVIIKQMTKKVEIIDSAQSGFLIGEHFDLDVIELWNAKLPKIKHVKYKPLILGISKASLQTDSFLSAASFQYTTRILSQAAFFKKRDFLKGLKENIIVGNIIPAGTGYLGNIEDLFKTN